MTEVFEALARMGWVDVLDILVATFLIYQVLLLIRGTRGWQMSLGAAALLLFYYLTRALNMQTVGLFLDYFITYFIFALIVIFQSEIRLGLIQLGRGSFLKRFFENPVPLRYDEVVLAATTLSSQRIGGLVVIEREIGLKNYIESGIRLDAALTYDLLVTIFNPKSPLHDGAVIISGDRISAAGCFLPLTLDPYLSKELGTRHRAAIGISRETDALAVVISEETGKISLVVDREMTRGLDGPRLLKLLKRHLDPAGKEGSGESAEGGSTSGRKSKKRSRETSGRKKLGKTKGASTSSLPEGGEATGTSPSTSS
ncbi:MAG TPA: diadenylate cyclase CdaA [Acidobacteriota bacterium]|nr:diadenylate cyclase CdaA [Acidobacteriota bacterium]